MPGGNYLVPIMTRSLSQRKFELPNTNKGSSSISGVVDGNLLLKKAPARSS